MGTIKSAGQNLTLICISLIVAIIFAELFLRIYIGNETHTVGGPAAKFNEKDMNHFYLRDQTIPNSNQVVIMALGDSFTYGSGINDPSKTWPKALEALINKTGNIVVINAGLPGLGTPSEHVIFDLTKEYYKPDIVIIGYSINDAITDEEYENLNLIYSAYLPRIIDETLLNKYPAAKEKIAPTADEVLTPLSYKIGNFLFTKSYLWFFVVTRYDTIVRKVKFAERYENQLANVFKSGKLSYHSNSIKLLISDIRDYGAEPIILIVPYPIRIDDYPFKEGHEFIKNIGLAENVQIIDPIKDFIGLNAEDLRVNKYDFHLNEKGNALVACTVFKEINISQSMERKC